MIFLFGGVPNRLERDRGAKRGKDRGPQGATMEVVESQAARAIALWLLENGLLVIFDQI